MLPSRPIPVASTRRRGFSLVLSLTVMSMLLLLCIGAAAMLAIELRVSRVSASYARARLNAIAGARIALGSLQGLAGTDRAITANAAILGADSGKAAQVRRPRVPGVWRSKVVAENYAAAHEQAFKGWLMSGKDAATGIPLADAHAASTAKGALDWMLSAGAEKADDEILLLNGGKLPYQGAPKLAEDFDKSPGSREPLSLYARPEYFNGADATSGAFAWVAMDENQKARVDLREYSETSPSNGGLADNDRAAFSASAAARLHPGYAADGATLGNWAPTADTKDTTLTGWASLALDTRRDNWFPLESDKVTPSRALRHDFTLGSVSLLTDTANGGLKRDLNTFALLADGDFDAEAANFGGAPGYVGMDNDRQGWYSGATASPATQGLFIWTGNDAKVWPTWSDVREWARLATTASGSGVVKVVNGAPTVEAIKAADLTAYLAGAATNPVDRTHHAAWRQPVLSRVRCEVFVQAQKESQVTPVTQVDIAYKINVSAQIWNPYNTKLKLPGGAYWMQVNGLPLAIRWYNGGSGGNGQFPNSFHVGVPLSGNDLEPGECRTFSLYPGKPVAGGVNAKILMEPGYSPSGGYISTVVLSAPSNANLTYAVGSLQAGRTPASASVLAAGSRDGTMNFFLTDSTTAPSGNAIASLGAQDCTWMKLEEKVDPTQKLPLPSVPELFTTPHLVGVYEYRLKSDKGSAYPGRFGLPALLGQNNWSLLTSSSPSNWHSGPMEHVGWVNDTPPDDIEKFGDAYLHAAKKVAEGDTGFLYTGNLTGSGLSEAVFYHLPFSPPVGLGDLRHARLGGGLRPISNGTRDTYANTYATFEPFASSLASPFVALSKVREDKGNITGTTGANGNFVGMDTELRPIDHSWVMNTALADSWFASSLGDWNKGATAQLFAVKKDYPAQLKEFFDGTSRLPNRRLAPLPQTNAETLWVNGTAATKTAYREIARGMLVEGGFNINSTSTRAWRAFLASSKDTKTVQLIAGQFKPAASTNPTALAAPVANAEPVTTTAATQAASNTGRVNGGRVLTEEEIDNLAVALVAEVKKRGPFLSLAEFLNRRVEDGELGQCGAVQAAINTAKLNEHRTALSMETPAGMGLPNTSVEKVYDRTGVGQPGWLSQADLIAPLLPAMTPRGDTFVIRTVGEDFEGARAYCELTVRRAYDFVDGRDKPETEFAPSSGSAQRTANKAFGRRFTLVAQRWIRVEDL